MEEKLIEIKIIELANPCTACIIVNNLTEEVVEKINKKYENFIDIEKIVLDTPQSIKSSELQKIDGLEVEKFPVLIINGEQITAGNIPDRRYISHMLDEILEDNKI